MGSKIHPSRRQVVSLHLSLLWQLTFMSYSSNFRMECAGKLTVFTTGWGDLQISWLFRPPISWYTRSARLSAEGRGFCPETQQLGRLILCEHAIDWYQYCWSPRAASQSKTFIYLVSFFFRSCGRGGLLHWSFFITVAHRSARVLNFIVFLFFLPSATRF
jgi:hypothetical protein